MRIIDMPAGDREIRQQAARLLVEAFKEHWPAAWPDLDSALEEVAESLRPGKISRTAIDADGLVLGWVGATGQYSGTAWELHPLVVAPAHQGKGIGRALANDLEHQVARRGGITIYLGADDEDGMTSLSGVDLYDDLLGHLSRVRNLKRHPYEFYQRLGYQIVGVIPDANGWGKPDILMAKRLMGEPGGVRVGTTQPAPRHSSECRDPDGPAVDGGHRQASGRRRPQGASGLMPG